MLYSRSSRIRQSCRVLSFGLARCCVKNKRDSRHDRIELFVYLLKFLERCETGGRPQLLPMTYIDLSLHKLQAAHFEVLNQDLESLFGPLDLDGFRTLDSFDCRGSHKLACDQLDERHKLDLRRQRHFANNHLARKRFG